jgi:hypothetical protein
MEHVSMFLAQMGEASTIDFTNVWCFPLSLTSTSFAWFTYLTTCSISSWAELEEKFHYHFYNGVHETRLSHITLVHQGRYHFYNGVHKTRLSHITLVHHWRDESILDFVKRFRDIKNVCFHLIIYERDLTDLAFEQLAF